MEDSAKRPEFTITQHHHSKLFLPAHLVTRDQPEANSKESNAVSKNAANGNKSSQKRKNSGKPDTGVGSHMGIDNDALEEIKKAGIDPGTVAVAHQKMALKQYEAVQKQQLAKPKKNKEMIEHKKRIQEAKDELKMEDWSGLDTSLLDIEKQKKLFEEATHGRKMQEESILKDKIIEVIRLQEEKTAQGAGVQRQGEDVDRQKSLQKEHRLHEETAQQQKKEAARKKRLQEEQHQKEEAARKKRLKEEQHQKEEAARKKRLKEEQHQREEAARKKRLQEENRSYEEATRRKKEEAAARQNRIQGEAAQQERWMIVQQNKKTCKTNAANKYDDNDSQSEEYYDTAETFPDPLSNKQESSPADAVSIPRNHDNITFGNSFNPDHFAKRPHHNVVTTQPYPKQGYKPMWSPADPQSSRSDPQSSKPDQQSSRPDSQSPNDNPYNLKVGSLIQFGNPPCYGVIKWIGTLPETEHVLMAGVEVVSCT